MTDNNEINVSDIYARSIVDPLVLIISCILTFACVNNPSCVVSFIAVLVVLFKRKVVVYHFNNDKKESLVIKKSAWKDYCKNNGIGKIDQFLYRTLKSRFVVASSSDNKSKEATKVQSKQTAQANVVEPLPKLNFSVSTPPAQLNYHLMTSKLTSVDNGHTDNQTLGFDDSSQALILSNRKVIRADSLKSVFPVVDQSIVKLKINSLGGTDYFVVNDIQNGQLSQLNRTLESIYQAIAMNNYQKLASDEQVHYRKLVKKYHKANHGQANFSLDTSNHVLFVDGLFEGKAFAEYPLGDVQFVNINNISSANNQLNYLKMDVNLKDGNTQHLLLDKCLISASDFKDQLRQQGKVYGKLNSIILS